ncbi:MAG: hypothetical protein V3R68_02940 [Gammaproteobacteria bacterium]
MHSLTLYIPGLLDPARHIAAEDFPGLASLETLLSRGKLQTYQSCSVAQTLCELFGLKKEPDRDLPIAAITRVIDDDHSLDGIWMRADPVHLAADTGGVVLMDESAFTLDQHDALVLAADIKDILAEFGLSLEAPTTNRWYLKLDKMPNIRTTAIHEVAGQNIHQYMPAGEDKYDWSQLINEIQMCLHASQINEKRRQRGELPVNSVWFWGTGTLPEQTDSSWSRVFSDEVIAQGLAKNANIPHLDLPESCDEILAQFSETDNILAVISFGLRHTQYHDLEGWLDFISYLEQCWFSMLLNSLKTGELGKLVVLTGNRKMTITRLSLYKMWKRRKSIHHYID